MNFKKIARILVCLILVCCLVVDVSPIKAEAVYAELVVTGVAAAGAIIALILAASGGAVYVPTATTTYNAMGNSFMEYMYQWGSTAEQLEESEAFFNGLSLFGNNPDDPDDDDDEDRAIRIPDALRRGVAAFTAAAILAECAIIEQKEVPATSGWSYYGNCYLPNYPSYGSYHAIVYCPSEDIYKVIMATRTFLFDSSSSTVMSGDYSYTYFYYQYLNSFDIPDFDVNVDNWQGTSIGFDTRRYTSVSCSGVELLWANFDVYSYSDSTALILAGSEPCTSFVQEVEVVPDSYVNDTKEQLANAIISANDLVVPDINYANLIGSDGSVLTGIQDILRRLDEGIITHEEFMEIVTAPVPEPAPDPEPSEDPTEPSSPEIIAPSTPDVDIEIDPDTLANTNAQTFLENLSNVVTTPFKWIWGRIESTFTPLLKPEIWLDPLPDIALEPAKWIWEKAEAFFEPLLSPDAQRAPFEWIWGKIEPIPGQISDAVTDAAAEVKEAVNALVVPDKDYLTDKVNALCAEFAFADAIVRTGQALHLGLANITTEPPVIYIDLGATRGSYNIGSRVPFLDLRWYSEYKPTVDTVISAFLWICFVWRMLVKLPGIISGLPGDFVMESAHVMGVTDFLPIRSAENERQRIESRKSIWKGRK